MNKILLLICCCLSIQKAGAQERDFNLIINPCFNNETLITADKKYINNNGDTLTITRFRFYISSVMLHFTDSSIYREPKSYHLIDAEEENTLSIKLKEIPSKQICAIEFNIGIDSLESVSGALDGDLDPVKGMYWAWNSGYINAKLEGIYYTGKKENEFEYHIGGYLKPYRALRHVSLPCTSLTGNTVTIIADASAWFGNVPIKKRFRIVMPGAEAMEMANLYSNMFRIKP